MPGKTIVYTALAVLILVGGLVGAMIAVNRLQRTAEQRSAAAAPARPAVTATPADAFTQAGFQVSAVILEKATNSSLVYAVGTIRNQTDRRRPGLKVEFELLDAAGKRVGTVTDYRQVLEPNEQWQFRTLVPSPKAAGMKVISIKTDP